MRINIPGAWIDLKEVSALTWDDEEAFDAVFARAAYAARFSDLDPDGGDDGMEVSGDGLTMKPRKKRTFSLTVEMVTERRDILLTRIITGWSFKLPLPYGPESKKKLPRTAKAALEEAVRPYIAELDGSGPKEKTEASDGSASTSRDGSRSHRRASPSGPSATASTSASTG